MSTPSDGILLADEGATLQAGRDLAASLAPAALAPTAFAPGAVLALVGPLGAGKTTLVKGIAEGLGIDPGRVTSPTFVLMQIHRGGRIPLVHIDAFRIGTP
ncbi:MAG: tRNA (adenosine(37)-N6)-threonylcarbamoyltransferase complex ATPase subunit type 1 TsaE, partial [Planctomycetes bacterium]|nr:tRNA (adenosine(37)-N6)-threonylcarbamoyltransferase complex ATPase subunit type 1 TsaE [Planctomycetota bacterium]